MQNKIYDLSTVKGRLELYLDFKHISKTAFGKSIGVSSSYVSAIRKSMDIDKIMRISEIYPDLDINWLLYGTGTMIKAPYERIRHIFIEEGTTEISFIENAHEDNIYLGPYQNAQTQLAEPVGLEQWVSAVLKRFPLYSKEWILYGIEPMKIGDSEPIKTFGFKPSKEESEIKIPLFEITATAGFSALYHDFSSFASEYITIPNLPPVDGAIYARGDSMSPLIASGDIVIFKKVDLIPENILWGHIYIVSYAVDGDDYTVLKYIRQSQREGYIRLESFNSRFDPQDIPASSITALALVKASITFHTIG